MYNKLEMKIISHSKGVAEVMYEFAEKNKEEMYILGLLHDIGKLNGFTNHEKNGALLFSQIGLKYTNEILYHGKVQGEYFSEELDLLNAADLSVGPDGDIIGYKKRIEDIGFRYGTGSDEYKNAVGLSEQLISLLERIEFTLSEGNRKIIQH